MLDLSQIRSTFAPRRRSVPLSIMSVQYAASYIGRSVSTVYRLVANGHIGVIRDGRRIFPFVDDLDAWLDMTEASSQGDVR